MTRIAFKDIKMGDRFRRHDTGEAWTVEALATKGTAVEMRTSTRPIRLKVFSRDQLSREFEPIAHHGGKRPGAGRPKGATSTDTPRDVKKQIRWTADEWAAVERLAVAADMTVTEFQRFRILLERD